MDGVVCVISVEADDKAGFLFVRSRCKEAGVRGGADVMIGTSLMGAVDGAGEGVEAGFFEILVGGGGV